MPNATRRQTARTPLDHDPAALRRRRVALGRTQVEVAAAVDISPGHLSELEGGTRNPSAPLLARLADALQCEIADLMPTQAGR